MEKIKLSRKDAEFIINKSFPSYKGRKISVVLVQPESKHSMVSEWSGGSRNSYKILGDTAETIISSSQYSNMHPVDQYKADPHWIANDKQILVEHIIFCGKDLGLRIYATPNCVMIPKNLLESKVE